METVTEALIELKLNKEAQPPPTANAAADDATLQQDTAAAEDTYERNKKKVTTYFLENDAGFRRLCEVRDKGWKSKDADRFFKNQRHQADQGRGVTVGYMHKMMQMIAKEMQGKTRAFSIKTPATETPTILDLCAAPGLFLEHAIKVNRGASALGFTLPYHHGGYTLSVKRGARINIKFLDITMLAEDMGVTDQEIPPENPHAQDFRPAEFHAGQVFDLVLCDGQVLRNHQPHRAAYREGREASRLLLTQLALGLDHLRPGGTMVVLLHRLESWDTVLLLRTFTKISSVELFKPRSGHAVKSSFYMIAKDVQSKQPEAVAAVEQWKEIWRTATFETDEQRWREVRRHVGADIPDVDAFLREFGPEVARMGREVWDIQADALERAPFMRKG
ncbi:hypothetical protein VSDG_09789 [Cytospora chrysosperma]|uniref:Ribosomal RNA methyltransferase FtsJ domain-containing protein n=1 Tax=Cytospora chrysosperma TaxID=252740 RepID=A0A423V9F8_CYTCH|nr:hypothetical protein VSDG_09789 [Valsa sordida]